MDILNYLSVRLSFEYFTIGERKNYIIFLLPVLTSTDEKEKGKGDGCPLFFFS
ncbi:MAG: hypothetical protein Q8P28_07500 [Deltaproteobacteria bacterium]|nr:hypothetical protein [Deltaproteobacteria bacterium]